MTDFTAYSPAPARPMLRRILPPLIIIPGIALLLTGFLTWVNLGFGPDFLPQWGKSCITALPVMVIALGLMGVTERAVTRALPGVHRVIRKIVLCLLTACLLELLLASAVTLINIGPGAGFAAAWATAFVASLPLGLAISLLMGFVVKPRLDRLMAA